MTGYMTFSTQALMQIDDHTQSGYECEQCLVEEWCDKESYLLWLVFHEFTHLLQGHNHGRHDAEFFSEVEALVRESAFLFH